MRPVRRSQRSRRKKYEVGDLVEIVHGNGVITGQLLHKMDPNRKSDDFPFWLVTFDEYDRDDEVICEKNFGPMVKNERRPSSRALPAAGKLKSAVLSCVEPETPDSVGKNDTKVTSPGEHNVSDSTAQSEAGSRITRGKSRKLKRRSVDSDATASNVKRRKKPLGEEDFHVEKMSFKEELEAIDSTEGAPAEVINNGNQQTHAVGLVVDNSLEVVEEVNGSSRDDNRRHRINTRAFTKGDSLGLTETVKSKTKEAKNCGTSTPPKRTNVKTPCRPVPKASSATRRSPRRSKKFNRQNNGVAEKDCTPQELVEKVNFLTGTLYLYRGENPRVVFIRRS